MVCGPGKRHAAVTRPPVQAMVPVVSRTATHLSAFYFSMYSTELVSQHVVFQCILLKQSVGHNLSGKFDRGRCECDRPKLLLRVSDRQPLLTGTCRC